jgi:homoaconitase/3-isopropylmalate dehydratase large subunit
LSTLYEKLVDRHTVLRLSEEEVLLYVSFHIMNEYTSPQAFAGLADAGRARQSIRAILDATVGCNVELVMKDTLTCRDEPHRVSEWVEIAMQEVMC